MIPLSKFEEQFYYFLALTLTLLGSAIIYYISKDIMAHFKFMKDSSSLDSNDPSLSSEDKE